MNYDNYYNYDALDRLIDMRQGSAVGTVLAQYVYSGAAGTIGNLTAKYEGGWGGTLGYSDPDHVHAVSSFNGSAYSYDRNGNISAHGAQEYFTFDVESRLTRNADQNGFGLQSDYTYDGQGSMVKRRITSWLYPGATDTKDVYVDGIYEERSYNCSAPGLPGKHYMAFGRMLATRTGSTLVYILADHLDSTRGTVNTSGGALATISYWPFGTVRSGWVGTDKQYTGQQKEFVSTLGAYYYKARFYSPATGTFLSIDPIGGSAEGGGQSWNPYAYGLNNPQRHSDPTGLVPSEPPWVGLHCDACDVLQGMAALGIYSPEAWYLTVLSVATMFLPDYARGPGFWADAAQAENPAEYIREAIAGNAAKAYSLHDLVADLGGITDLRTMFSPNAGFKERALATVLLLSPLPGDQIPLRGFASLERLSAHFAEHGAELGARTEIEYLVRAGRLVERGLANDSSVELLIRSNGDRLIWDSTTREFAIVRNDGVLRTYFKPTGTGNEYWEKQIRDIDNGR